VKNFKQYGQIVYVEAPTGGVKSGDLVVIGSLFGVAGTDADAHTTVAINTKGIYELPAETDDDWAPGDLIYWDDGAGACTATNSGSLLRIGICVAAKETNAAVGGVRLTDP